MQAGAPGVVARAWGRVKHWAGRVDQRARGLPMRLEQRRIGIPVPPSGLLYTVGGSDDVRWFLRSGRLAAEGLRGLLAKNGVEMRRLAAVLDFGCGVGRVLRHYSDLAAAGVSLHGTDRNVELVDWCRRHLGFATFGHNRVDGRLEYPDDTLDLVYAFSVFTHLTEARQLAWMEEIRRVLRPGGLLAMSLHGSNYGARLGPGLRDRFSRGELIVLNGRDDDEGGNACAAFHPEAYVRDTMAVGWEIVDFLREGAHGNPKQDLYLIRKPAVEGFAAA